MTQPFAAGLAKVGYPPCAAARKEFQPPIEIAMNRARGPNVDLLCHGANLMKSQPGPPKTLGNATAAHVRLIV